MKEQEDPFKDSPEIQNLIKEGREKISQIDAQIDQQSKEKGPQPELKPTGTPSFLTPGDSGVNRSIYERFKNDVIQEYEQKFDDLSKGTEVKGGGKDVFRDHLTRKDVEKDMEQKVEAERKETKGISASQNYMSKLLSTKYKERSFERSARDITKDSR